MNGWASVKQTLEANRINQSRKVSDILTSSLSKSLLSNDTVRTTYNMKLHSGEVLHHERGTASRRGLETATGGTHMWPSPAECSQGKENRMLVELGMNSKGSNSGSPLGVVTSRGRRGHLVYPEILTASRYFNLWKQVAINGRAQRVISKRYFLQWRWYSRRHREKVFNYKIAHVLWSRGHMRRVMGRLTALVDRRRHRQAITQMGNCSMKKRYWCRWSGPFIVLRRWDNHLNHRAKCFFIRKYMAFLIQNTVKLKQWWQSIEEDFRGGPSFSKAVEFYDVLIMRRYLKLLRTLVQHMREMEIGVMEAYSHGIMETAFGGIVRDFQLGRQCREIFNYNCAKRHLDRWASRVRRKVGFRHIHAAVETKCKRNNKKYMWRQWRTACEERDMNMKADSLFSAALRGKLLSRWRGKVRLILWKQAATLKLNQWRWGMVAQRHWTLWRSAFANSRRARINTALSTRHYKEKIAFKIFAAIHWNVNYCKVMRGMHLTAKGHADRSLKVKSLILWSQWVNARLMMVSRSSSLAQERYFVCLLRRNWKVWETQCADRVFFRAFMGGRARRIGLVRQGYGMKEWRLWCHLSDIHTKSVARRRHEAFHWWSSAAKDLKYMRAINTAANHYFLSKMFREWVARISQTIAMVKANELADTFHDSFLCKDMWGRWRGRFRIRLHGYKLAGVIHTLLSRALVRRVLSSWYKVLMRRHTAFNVTSKSHVSTLRRSMATWRKHLRYNHREQILSATLGVHIQCYRKHRALGAWVEYIRAQFATRGKFITQVVGSLGRVYRQYFFRTFLDRIREALAYDSNVLVALCHFKDCRTRWCLSQWGAYLSQLRRERRNMVSAERHYWHYLVYTAWSTFIDSCNTSRRIKRRDAVAVRHHARSRLAKCFKPWRSFVTHIVTVREKGAILTRHRLQKWMKAWRESLQHSCRQRELAITAEYYFGLALRRSCFAEWRKFTLSCRGARQHYKWFTRRVIIAKWREVVRPMARGRRMLKRKQLRIMRAFVSGWKVIVQRCRCQHRLSAKAALYALQHTWSLWRVVMDKYTQAHRMELRWLLRRVRVIMKEWKAIADSVTAKCVNLQTSLALRVKKKVFGRWKSRFYYVLLIRSRFISTAHKINRKVISASWNTWRKRYRILAIGKKLNLRHCFSSLDKVFSEWRHYTAVRRSRNMNKIIGRAHYTRGFYNKWRKVFQVRVKFNNACRAITRSKLLTIITCWRQWTDERLLLLRDIKDLTVKVTNSESRAISHFMVHSRNPRGGTMTRRALLFLVFHSFLVFMKCSQREKSMNIIALKFWERTHYKRVLGALWDHVNNTNQEARDNMTCLNHWYSTVRRSVFHQWFKVVRAISLHKGSLYRRYFQAIVAYTAAVKARGQAISTNLKHAEENTKREVFRAIASYSFYTQNISLALKQRWFQRRFLLWKILSIANRSRNPEGQLARKYFNMWRISNLRRS